MKKQTTSEWIRKHYQECGRAFVTHARLKAKDETGHDMSETTWNRCVRRIIKELQDSNGEPVSESHLVKSMEDALEYHDFPEHDFDVSKITVNTWGSETNPNQQVKLEAKKREFTFNPETWRDMFNEAVGVSYKPKVNKAHNKKTNLTCQISLPDMHVGQMIWKEAVGRNSDEYTVESSLDLYMNATRNLTNDLKYKDIKRIVFPFGEDFFNVDNLQNSTTKGTPQTNDDPKKAIQLGLAVVFQVIEALADIADVHVPVISGNHDNLTSFMAGICLEQYFRNDKRVTVDAGATRNKCYGSGNWGIVFMHGKKKPTDMAWVFPNEYPQLWEKTKYREVHSGHFHHLSQTEIKGVRVLFLPSLCPKDNWHTEEMYESVREAQRFLWHDEYGKISTTYFRPGFLE